ncbi:MAG: PQQ-binding-like beta-propeller repeat protein [Verrucomicrobia bacterium]|nr:PQQ-binding-like beta-propeller repeat protein [Verrucomicrobiota bacterium]MBI3868406.1 PQQ-binding-like beta-propeller repeat protein [Verrucomicrobiota bacterium]
MKRIFSSIVLLVAASASAAESWWPQFRGPNCSGVSETARPPAAFGPGDHELWRVPVPPGASSPVSWGDRVFLSAFDGGRLEVHCYAAKDGRPLWKRAVPVVKLEEFHSAEGSPAASSCATEGRRVVSYFGSYGLICHDFEGKELWRHPLPLAETTGGFGTGSSPTLTKDLVLLNRDMMHGCSLVAVNLKTGRLAWQTSRPDVTQSYGSTILWNNSGVEEIVMSGSLKLKAYDPKTGKEKWSLAGMPSFTCTTPVAGDGLLFFAGWSPGKSDQPMPTFEQTAAAFDKNKDGAITPDEVKGTPLETFFRAQDLNGDGKITAEDVAGMKAMMSKGENLLVAVRPGGKGELGENQVAWKQTRGLPYVPSPLYYRGRVYLVKDGGMVSSYDAKTGSIGYQQERLNAQGSYYASPVAADGRIIVASLDGKVTVFAAGGDAPKVLHQADFKERIAATPALVENRIYMRTATALYAFGE